LHGRNTVSEMFRLSDPLDLYLVRHPKPRIDDGLCYGISDLPVAEDPAACAARLAPLLPRAACVLSSTLLRARVLAEALDPAARCDPRLSELDFGEWEMKPFADIPVEGFDAWGDTLVDFRAPAGELYADMAARVWAAFDEHRQGARHLVIVGHNGPMRVLAGTLLGLPANRWLNLEFAFGRLTHLAIGPLGAKLHGFNL
jgi:alpha-ribazole phosphatase